MSFTSFDIFPSFMNPKFRASFRLNGKLTKLRDNCQLKSTYLNDISYHLSADMSLILINL